MASLEALIAEVCRRYDREGNVHRLRDVIAAVTPVLERGRQVAISVFLVEKAIRTIDEVYAPDPSLPPSWQEPMSGQLALVGTHLKRAIGREPTPFLWDPHL